MPLGIILSGYNRENLSERFGMEYFTADTVKEAAGRLDSYTNYLNMVSTIKNTEDSYGESQKQNIERSKQIYAVIGNDCEIIVNSGVNFPVIHALRFFLHQRHKHQRQLAHNIPAAITLENLAGAHEDTVFARY